MKLERQETVSRIKENVLVLSPSEYDLLNGVLRQVDDPYKTAEDERVETIRLNDKYHFRVVVRQD